MILCFLAHDCPPSISPTNDQQIIPTLTETNKTHPMRGLMSSFDCVASPASRDAVSLVAPRRCKAVGGPLSWEGRLSAEIATPHL